MSYIKVKETYSYYPYLSVQLPFDKDILDGVYENVNVHIGKVIWKGKFKWYEAHFFVHDMETELSPLDDSDTNPKTITVNAKTLEEIFSLVLEFLSEYSI